MTSTVKQYQPSPISEKESQIIKVNGVEISEKDIGIELQYHPSESAEVAYNEALNALIVRQVLLQQAKSLGIDNENNLSQCPPGNDESIDGGADTVVENEEETAEETAIRLLIDREIDTPVADGNTCYQYYQSNRARFTTTSLIEVSHILLSAHPDDTQERTRVKSVAEKLISELMKKPDLFKKFVKQYSSCPSNKVSGSLGQLTRGQTTPEFERAVFSLAEGLASYPVESRYGFHIVRIDRTIPGKQLEYEMVEERIKNYLDERVRRKSMSQYIQLLIAQAEITGIDFDIEKSFLMQ